MSNPASLQSPSTGQFFAGTQLMDLHMRGNDNPWRRRFPVESYPINTMYNEAVRIPFDTAGWSTRMQIRHYEGQLGGPVVALDLTTYTTYSDGTVHSDGSPFSQGGSANGSGIVTGNGFVEVFITLGDLELLRVGPPHDGPALFTYDLLLQPPDGDENAWYSGKVIFNLGTTRYAVLDSAEQQIIDGLRSIGTRFGMQLTTEESRALRVATYRYGG